MDIALPIAIGALFAASVYMMLGRDLIRIAIRILLLGVAANLLIFVAGRIAPGGIPPLVPEGAMAAAADGANPLPQALILTVADALRGPRANDSTAARQDCHNSTDNAPPAWSPPEGGDAAADAAAPSALPLLLLLLLLPEEGTLL